MPNFIWSKDYKADLGSHVFPIEKYGLIRDRAIKEKILKEQDFIEPKPCSEKDLLRVHTKRYLRRLRLLAASHLGMLNGENPVNKSILKASQLNCGGTYLACKITLKNKIAMNIGGGLHHAMPDHESGFCYYNDPAVAIKKLKAEDNITKIMVIDCDVHQGDGTAVIFKDDPDVFTFSIHQEDNFPPKQKSNCDIGLYSHENVGDKLYLEKLNILEKLIRGFKPELILYLAGSDPYKDDKLGGFKLTIEGLRKRDEYVIGLAVKFDIAIAVCLAGGYAQNTDDVVRIHLNTIEVMKKYIK